MRILNTQTFTMGRFRLYLLNLEKKINAMQDEIDQLKDRKT